MRNASAVNAESRAASSPSTALLQSSREHACMISSATLGGVGKSAGFSVMGRALKTDTNDGKQVNS